MRLGDFRKETEHLSDDVVLNGIWCIQILPGYYDGYPHNCIEDWKVEISDEQKINFIPHDYEVKYHDVRDGNLSYEENLEKYLSYFVRGKNITDNCWNRQVEYITTRFKSFWEEEHK